MDRFTGNDNGRLAATALIWSVVGLISISGMIFNGLSAGLVFITLFGMIFAYTSTNSLWGGKAEDKADARDLRADRLAEKRKRGEGDTKAEMLLALMDDDEREAFKRALQDRMLEGARRLSDDGELTADDLSIESLEAMLAQDRGERGDP